MIRRHKSVVLSVAAVIAITCHPGILWAQNCGDLPPRTEVSKQRLAVKLSGSWEFFTPQLTEPAHVLSVAKVRNLCLAWEAPPYPGRRKQIVYASTQYMKDQPIWLWRNNAAQIPFISNILGDWSRKPDSSGRDPEETFKAFHSSMPEDVGVVPWKGLADWHDTSAWLPNQHSYDVVAAALGDPTGSLPYGTERLLALKGRRPLSSWVPFTTYPPKPQDRLLVAVTFSGDLDSRGPRVYHYTFEGR